MKNKTKMLSIVLAIVMILTSVSIGVPTFAASKPSATQITSIKAVDNGFKVTWNKVSGAQNYDVQCSFDKNFKHDVYRFSSNNGTTTTKSFTEIGKNDDRDYYAEKTWYFRVRYYDKNFKAKPWSNVVSKISYEMNDYQNLMNNAFNEMGIVSTDSDFDKVIKIQHWIDSHWKYGYANEEIQAGYSLAKNKKGVCEDFADNFNIFCKKANIQSYKLGGASNNRGALHSWNFIEINGYWYNYDCEVTFNSVDELKKNNAFPTRFCKESWATSVYKLDNYSQNIYDCATPKANDSMINSMQQQLNEKLYK